MKRFLTLLTISLGVILACNSCEPTPKDLGSIYGIVTDMATGEPVRSANVQLRPSGETVLTGNDGRYEFLELKDGNYSIIVSKTGYTDLIDDYVVTVDGSKAMRRDVQIEKLPPELMIMDGNNNNITELDFGSMHDDNTRMFNIFNNGTVALDFDIVKTAPWIESISPINGNLKPGATKPVVIIVDRNKMAMGNNTTSISITTNEGGKLLTIKANKAGDVSTFHALEITKTSALMRGSVNVNVTYTEKGFFYGGDLNMENKQVVSGFGIGEFSFHLANLESDKTYYYKAYMKLNGETVFGEMVSFKTLNENGDDNNDDNNNDNDGDDYGNDSGPHECVDLGLPSGLKWASCNMGASSPEDYGNYYAWGEVITDKYAYKLESCSTAGVDLGNISGNAKYDAARADWGGMWRMPSLEDFTELIEMCEWTSEERNGVKGWKVAGLNGKSIFLPLAGRVSGFCDEEGFLSGDGSYGYYWSSTPFNSNTSAILKIDSYTYSDQYTCLRYQGCNIRPVTE